MAHPVETPVNENSDNRNNLPECDLVLLAGLPESDLSVLVSGWSLQNNTNL